MRKARIATGIELLECRELLSVTMILAHQAIKPPVPTITQIAAQADGSVVIPPVTPSANIFTNPPPGSVLTPNEVKRQKQFSFAMAGKYVIGPGRFTDQAASIYIKAVGESTYFLSGDLQVGITVPKDTSQSAQGNATSYDKNVNTNAAFSFDLVAVPGATDKYGRPTQFTISTDVNASAGVFDESTSRGLLTIRYLTGKPNRNGFSTGMATVTIKGLAYTLGTIGNLGVIGTVNSNNPKVIALSSSNSGG